MAADLADYEAAFERVERARQLRRDWGAAETRIQRQLARPTWRLVRTLLIVLVCVGAGLGGVGPAWAVAIGLSLAVLPDRVSRVRERRRALAAVETAEDLRALCAKESELHMSGMFLRSLALGALGLVYLVVALVAWQLDKSPLPGVIAGLVALAWSAVSFLVLFPRACREAELFEVDDAA